MDQNQYSAEGIALQVLIDEGQWQRLNSELGKEMLREFADEYIQETLESWVDTDTDPLTLPDAAFKSLSHRSAGAAGTIGFKRLRYCFLCMEHLVDQGNRPQFVQLMKSILADTQAWLSAQST
ncbi:MAG: hypothetical protein QE278_00315 [Limnobacter sp.]|nr:hypothetical protein [Limnobacter sp.]